MSGARQRLLLPALAIGWRSIHTMLIKPSFLVPSLVMPLFFFVAFAGGLSALSSVPSFDYPNYSTFQYVFVLSQVALFSGVFTGFSIAADFEFGMARRLMLALSDRRAMLGGYAIIAGFRALLTWTVITVIALLSGADITGSGLDLFSLALTVVLLNLIGLLFAFGVATRLRSLQGAPLIQLPMFLVLMTAPVYVPRPLIEGWVGTVSDYNPLTATLEAGRQWVIGGPGDTILVALVTAGLIALMALFALTGLHRAERAAA